MASNTKLQFWPSRYINEFRIKDELFGMVEVGMYFVYLLFSKLSPQCNTPNSNQWHGCVLICFVAEVRLPKLRTTD